MEEGWRVITAITSRAATRCVDPGPVFATNCSIMDKLRKCTPAGVRANLKAGTRQCSSITHIFGCFAEISSRDC